MTVKEWREQNPDVSHTLVFASGAGSFGHKGGSVYGSTEVVGKMEIVDIEMHKLSFPEPHDFPVLHVWDSIVCEPLERGC